MSSSTKSHQEIGQELKLFMIHEFSPGSIFFLPHGQRIYQRLQSLIRHEYDQLDYQEVQTPNLFNSELWKISGHWEHYKDNMFQVNVGDTIFAEKAMNCPCHCLIYQNEIHSYRDLPIRYADFGALHRNEVSGSLVGLTRVRRFCQDDAHIFCTEAQIVDEIQQNLEFLKRIYDQFGFTFSVNLSTRPLKFMGDPTLWDLAEQSLESVLKNLNFDYTIDPQGGAFYGPKIDIKLKDSLGREHQCGTIQLDFQLPINFKLKYKDKFGELKTPVIIHRAILGSVERFMAIVLEHYQGRLPIWLSPRQICIVPVSKQFLDYANQVKTFMKTIKGLNYVDVDSSDDLLKKKVRNAEVLAYNYIFVVGQKELDNQSVAIRKDGKIIQTLLQSELLTCKF